MTVRPGRVAARGGASWIEQARLDQDQKRTVRMFSPPHVGLAGCQLLDRSADVHGPGPPARFGLPRDRAVQRPVHLEDRRAIAEPPEPTPVPGWQRVAGDARELARGDVEQNRAGRRQVGRRVDRAGGQNLPAERPQLRHQRLGDPLRTSLDDRPPDQVRKHAEEQRDASSGEPRQRQDRMRGHPSHQSAGPLRLEAPGQAERGSGGANPEPGQGNRVPGHVCGGRQEVLDELVPLLDQRSERSTPLGTVAPQPNRRLVERSFGHRGRPVVERMRQRGAGLHPVDPQVREGQRGEER